MSNLNLIQYLPLEKVKDYRLSTFSLMSQKAEFLTHFEAFVELITTYFKRSIRSLYNTLDTFYFSMW